MASAEITGPSSAAGAPGKASSLGKRRAEDDGAGGPRKHGPAAGRSGGPGARPKKWNRGVALEGIFEITDRTSEGKEVRETVYGWCDLVERVSAPQRIMDVFDEKEGERRSWDSHCVQVDEIWGRYAPQFAKICGCDEAILVKPSGKLNSTASILWHYPTFNTAMERYGMVFDPSNKCLNLQLVKLGIDAVHALTVDMFPMRARPPKAEQAFYSGWPFWAEFRDLAVQFQREITAASKVRIVLGKEDWHLVSKDLERQEDLVVTRVKLSDLQVFGGKAHFLLVRDLQGAIKQIVLPSYHLQWLYHAERTERNLEVARMMDVVWNFAGAVVGMDTVHTDYFEWSVDNSVKEDSLVDVVSSVDVDSSVSEGYCDWVNMKKGDLYKAGEMLGWEKRNHPIDEALVARVFSTWLEFNSARLNPEHGSLCRQIYMVMATKTWQVNKEKGQPGLVAGMAVHLRNLEVKLEGKWAVAMRDIVPTWETSNNPRDQRWATRLREACGTEWRERAKVLNSAGIKWYSEKNPTGRRYEGDGGPSPGEPGS